MKAILLSALLMSTLPISADPIVDDFSDPDFKGRSAERGDWKFADKSVTCASDPELYKKYKNHGPIIRWPAEFTDGTIEFEMKPSKCQRVVFTLNGDGHVFRIIHADPSAGNRKITSRILVWATKSSKENKGDTLKPEGLPDLPALNDKWTKVKVAIKKGKATVSIGEFSTKIEHAALAREKNSITLSFAFGDCALRNFKYTDPK